MFLRPKMEIIIPLLQLVMADLQQNYLYVSQDWQDSDLLSYKKMPVLRGPRNQSCKAPNGRNDLCRSLGRAPWGSSNLLEAEDCCYDNRDSCRGREERNSGLGGL